MEHEPVVRTGAGYRFVQDRVGRLAELLMQPQLSAADRDFLLECGTRLHGERLEQLQQCDLLIFQPEGTLGGTLLHKGVGLLLLPTIFRRLWSKPVLAINGTLYSVFDSFEEVLRQAFARFDLLACRELASWKYAQQLGLRHAVVLPDSAFLAQADTSELTEVCTPHLPDAYFCVSGGATMAAMDVQQYAQVLHRIAEDHQLAPVCCLSTKQDEPMWRELSRLRNDVCRISPDASYQQVVGILAGARFQVGARYHISILAAVAGTPFIPISSNSFKTEGLVELLNWPVDVLKLHELEQIPKWSTRFRQEPAAWQERLQAGGARVQKMLQEASQVLAPWLGKLRPEGTPEELEPASLATLQPKLSSGMDRIDPELLAYYRSLTLELDRRLGFKG